MEKEWFNPLNYWLMITAGCVLADLVLRRGMYVALVGVGAFIAAFLASVRCGLITQIVAFILVSGFLVLKAHRSLLAGRLQTEHSIEDAFKWINDQDPVTLEPIRGWWAPGRIAVGDMVLPARSKHRIDPGRVVDVISTGRVEVVVRPRT
ncbi:MAG: hypothetical protein J7M25_00265 [Deltaproteobacteria bacterium]|nr:hypothetical protein [Deltaproteobacteria bacterium]